MVEAVGVGGDVEGEEGEEDESGVDGWRFAGEGVESVHICSDLVIVVAFVAIVRIVVSRDAARVLRSLHPRAFRGSPLVST